MRKTIAIYYVTAGLLLLFVSAFCPPTVAESSLLGVVDRLASQLLPDAVTASRGSDHPAAVRISYLTALGAAAIGAALLMALIWRAQPSLPFKNRSSIRVSPLFMLVAGTTVVAIPFLPLLPTSDVHAFRAIELAIQKSRWFLAIWNVVFLVGYSVVLFSLIFGVTSLIRGEKQ